MTPAEQSLIARIAVQTSWANTADRTVRTEPGRVGLRAKYERQAREMHPDAPEATVIKAAEALYSAHFARMSLASARSRAKKTPNN
jgi:hypothetical protein